MCSKSWSSLMIIFMLHSVSGLNILGIFEVPSKSLHILGDELMLGLAKRGYNVTLMSAFPLETKLPNYKHVFLDGLVQFKDENYAQYMQGSSQAGPLAMLNAQLHFVDIALKSKSMQDFLKNDNKYDIIIQTYVMNEAYLGLAHHFDARVIGFVPFTGMPMTTALTGNSAPYSYVPVPVLGQSDNMTFVERTWNTVIGTFMSLMHEFYTFPQQEKLRQKYFPGAPPLADIQKERVDLIFANVDFFNETPRPRTPNIIYIGGYHVQNPEPLPADLKSFMDNATEGVAFLGFGTNVDPANLPPEKIDAFVNKFAKMPYKVLFKYNGNLPNKPKNVLTAPWYPQRGILAHPNTKIFISHGGKGSATESLYNGVPTLCVSFFGDQKKNCEDIVNYGYGVHLPFQEVTKQTFSDAMDELINNPKYAKNAKFRADLFKEQEMSPFDRACFWIEHVHKFKGAKHLRPKSVDMPLYQYLLFDVWAFILTVTVLSLILLYKIIKLLFRCVIRKNNKETIHNKKIKEKRH